ncbi:MAG: FadR/GntR family transcriptional regulator [Acidimicrobiales bacterium]
MMREVVRRDLSHGDRLASEPVLMGYFGVSRGSLREALRVLSFLGAIDVRTGPGGGPRIARPESTVVASALAIGLQFRHASHRTLLEARAVIEPAVAEMAATAGKDDQLAAMEACVRRLYGAVGTAGFRAEHRMFHQLLGSASGNEALALVVSAFAWISATAEHGWERPLQRRVAKQARSTLDSLRARDGGAAGASVAAMFRAALDGGSRPAALSGRIVWADVDELIETTPDPQPKGGNEWT